MSAIDKTVDPALWPLIEAFPPIDVCAANLADFRVALAGLATKPEPSSHPDVTIEELWIEGSGAAAERIRGLLLSPAHGASFCALLHVHGGGYVMGAPEMDVARNIELVRATGCSVLSVDYRLAPEHPHPAGLEDCHAALAWLSARFAGRRIGVIGESAGGGLAAALALIARDRKAVSLACQILIYPMLMPADRGVFDARIGRYIWTQASNRFCWKAFLGSAPADPRTIAGLATDLADLPPAFIAVGDLDLFVHDNLAYASRLLAAGSSVEAHVYAGAVHGFDRRVDAEVSVRFFREVVGFLRRHLHPEK